MTIIWYSIFDSLCSSELRSSTSKMLTSEFFHCSMSSSSTLLWAAMPVSKPNAQFSYSPMFPLNTVRFMPFSVRKRTCGPPPRPGGCSTVAAAAAAACCCTCSSPATVVAICWFDCIRLFICCAMPPIICMAWSVVIAMTMIPRGANEQTVCFVPHFMSEAQ